MRFASALLVMMLTFVFAAVPAAALRAIEPTEQRPRLELRSAQASSDKPNIVLDGDVLKNPVRLFFNIQGDTKVAPAGDHTPGTGHFHLLIDSTLTPEELKQPIPSDDQHIHYGKGQTEATITLPPGKHTLQLLLGDGNHVPHDPPIMSDPVTVIVE